MVNVRQMPGGGEGVQVIRIRSIPLAILGKPVGGMAKLGQSWYSFLEEKGIKLTPRDGFCVKTNGKLEPTADLNDPVGELIRKFDLRRSVHTFKLVAKESGGPSGARIRGATPPRPLMASGMASGPQIVIPLNGGSPTTSSSTAGMYRKPRYTPQTGSSCGNYGTRLRTLITRRQQGEEAMAGPTVRIVKIEGPPSECGDEDAQSFVAPLITSVRSLPLVKMEPPEPESSGDPSDTSNAEVKGDGDADETSSVVTSASVENVELGREGIQVKDVKSYAERRMATFEPSFLRGVRKEYKNLRKDRQKWDRNARRAPLAMYLLHELFK